MALEEAKWQVLGTDSSPYPLCQGDSGMNSPTPPTRTSVPGRAHVLPSGPELCRKGVGLYGPFHLWLFWVCQKRISYAPALKWRWRDGVGLGRGTTNGALKAFFSLEKNVNFSISLRLENINDFNIPEIVPYHLEQNSSLQTLIFNYFKFMIELLSTPVNTLCSTLMIPIVVGETGHRNWSFSLFLWRWLLNRLNITSLPYKHPF